MIIAEILENCANDAERLITLNTLKKQIEDQEKSLKAKLIEVKIHHSRIQYVERKDWVPSTEIQWGVRELDKQKKDLIEKSKSENLGSYKTSTYIKVVEPKANEIKQETAKGPDLSSFFLGDPNNL